MLAITVSPLEYLREKLIFTLCTRFEWWNMSINLADCFEGLADTLGDREAIVFEGQRRTYAQLDEEANQVGNFLMSIGVGHNDHVAMHMRNCLEFFNGLVGTLKVRAVPVNINFRYTQAELVYLYNNSDSKVLFVETEFLPVVADALNETTTLEHIIVIGDVTAEFRAAAEAKRVKVYAYHPEVDSASTERAFPARSGDDHFLVYTGGTTGNPKGVIWRHEDFYYAALAGGNQYGDPHETVEALCDAAKNFPAMSLLVTAPMIHGAAIYAMFSMFFMGSKQVLMRNWDAADALKLIGDEQIQIIMIVGDAMGVPFVDELVENFDSYDVSSLFSVSSGGAIWSQASRDKLKTVLPEIFIRDSFGASESGTDGTLTMGEDGSLRLPPSKNTQVVDDNLNAIAPGSDDTGFLARVGHVPLGYYGDEEKTAKTFPVKDGVRMSVLGDMARVEEDGTIVVLGRGSGCINTGGEKVFPEEVEQALKSHPAVFDSLVAGAKDSRYGERVAATISIREGSPTPSTDELVEHCRTKIAGYKVPRTIVVVDEVVRSPSGKADYQWAKRTVTEAVEAEEA